jgi:hypothetical protein
MKFLKITDESYANPVNVSYFEKDSKGFARVYICMGIDRLAEYKTDCSFEEFLKRVENFGDEKTFRPEISSEKIPDEVLHSRLSHPDYEYETTTGGRKDGTAGDPPEGNGWEINKHYNDGFERFDYHEECYWMRKKYHENFKI